MHMSAAAGEQYCTDDAVAAMLACMHKCAGPGRQRRTAPATAAARNMRLSYLKMPQWTAVPAQATMLDHTLTGHQEPKFFLMKTACMVLALM
jgi:hypothetical protein